MNLAMTLVIRNEADIIDDNLRYHRAQGVDFFIALDNGSDDGTLEILESYERAGILRLVRMPGPQLRIQRQGATRIGRMAHEMGADWVIHNDADEFWWPVTGNLKESLAAIPEQYGIVLAPRTEFVPRPEGEGSFAERLTIRETRFRRPPKTAHRAHPLIKMWERHPIDLWVKSERAPRSGLVGKPALRAQPIHAEDQELDLVLAPEFPIGVLHFPLRSYEQYRKKIEIADDNGFWGRNAAAQVVHEAYVAGRLEAVYANLILDDRSIAEGLADGWLVEDTEFRDYLRGCPGVLEKGEAPQGSRAWPVERRRAALAGLRDDGMYAISRYLQAFAFKKRKRQVQYRELKRLRGRVKDSEREIRQLQKQSERLQRRSRRLEKVERSRWWKMRPRLPKQRRPGH
jgi:glycosyl transferase family 2